MFGTAAKRRIKRSDMNSIATQYLGLELSGPVIMGSSGLTSTLRHIVEAEEAGAGAVVLKSVFEEQILHEASRLDRYSDYPEAGDYVRRYVSEHALAQYLDLIREARDRCAIPVIASIHCVHPGKWVSFARSIEQAGASAIELNIFVLPTDAGLPSEQIERAYFDIAAQVREVVSVPLAVKLGAGFTNPLRIVRGLYARGIQGVVLFNRFYPADRYRSSDRARGQPVQPPVRAVGRAALGCARQRIGARNRCGRFDRRSSGRGRREGHAGRSFRRRDSQRRVRAGSRRDRRNEPVRRVMDGASCLSCRARLRRTDERP